MKNKVLRIYNVLNVDIWIWALGNALNVENKNIRRP
jgi:hypothetical protein